MIHNTHPDLPQSGVTTTTTTTTTTNAMSTTTTTTTVTTTTPPITEHHTGNHTQDHATADVTDVINTVVEVDTTEATVPSPLITIGEPIPVARTDSGLELTLVCLDDQDSPDSLFGSDSSPDSSIPIHLAGSDFSDDEFHIVKNTTNNFPPPPPGGTQIVVSEKPLPTEAEIDALMEYMSDLAYYLTIAFLNAYYYQYWNA